MARWTRHELDCKQLIFGLFVGHFLLTHIAMTVWWLWKGMQIWSCSLPAMRSRSFWAKPVGFTLIYPSHNSHCPWKWAGPQKESSFPTISGGMLVSGGVGLGEANKGADTIQNHTRFSCFLGEVEGGWSMIKIFGGSFETCCWDHSLD